MAGDWLKVELSLHEKPEVFTLAGKLGLDPDTVVGKLIRLWSWANQHVGADGNASVTVCNVDSIVGCADFAKSMLFVGWLVLDEGGTVSFPKWDRHNSQTAKQRALTRERVYTYRLRKSNDGGVTESLPEKRREDVRTPLPPASGGMDRPRRETRAERKERAAKEHAERQAVEADKLALCLKALRRHIGQRCGDWEITDEGIRGPQGFTPWGGSLYRSKHLEPLLHPSAKWEDIKVASKADVLDLLRRHNE